MDDRGLKGDAAFCPAEVKSSFREVLAGRSRFIYTVELVPGRGSRGKSQEQVLRFAGAGRQGRPCPRPLHHR